jgi:hypothetical protein
MSVCVEVFVDRALHLAQQVEYFQFLFLRHAVHAEDRLKTGIELAERCAKDAHDLQVLRPDADFFRLAVSDDLDDLADDAVFIRLCVAPA